ncbi:diguanylate cyclase/phosphodiesterase with PAS/PAC and GAF sensor [Novosphingobium nitrogenifigens DSM 19370]|uniref:Diguanylate cyclase/phosphodiesterase with PAS/PAC and GAF sensor n=1 Tax=Novosphingobium nitrogenifigens DSM 19370 TaxID=983920 RepID=F1ZAR7_9SPHN|nr:diguanylate cyclase/phosphodiesterase with PAS/PAC and GAF sensor [Novosphingobium nitrogenifigens DSM 19370]
MLAIVKFEPIPQPPIFETVDDGTRIERLERQLLRERKARREAEEIAENGLRELRESRRHLALLQRITDRANHADEIREALAFAITEICVEMGWDFGNAYLVQGGRDVVACDCWHLAAPVGWMPFVDYSRNARFPRGTCLPGRVLADGRMHWIDDMRAEPEFLRRDLATQCGVISACAFPVIANSEVFAVCEFFSHDAVSPSEAMSETIAQIGIQLSRVVERVRSRAALLHDALHDALTTLPNRVLLHERASSAFARLPATGKGLGVMVIDLDGFKAVNDKLGHHAGDCILVAAAARLRDAMNEALVDIGKDAKGTLARTGGDEFVVLLEGVNTPAIPLAIAERILAEVSMPFEVGRDEITISASIGIALSNASYHDYDEVQRDADLAMYQAKSSGHGHTVVFTCTLGKSVRLRMALEREIREAIREKQFVLHYQPILDLTSREIKGFEALVRWKHPERGLVLPYEFIPTAEETGLIVFIGDWVLHEACQAMARLHARCRSDDLPFIAVNIAPQQFLQSDFVAYLRKVIEDTGVPPHCLKLEVTEGVAILDADRTRRVLEECRGIGVRTGLDDFGTGYSSLSYLHSLPFDTIKIDRSFIAALDQPKSRKIVHTILDLAINLDLNVVAEGIETTDQQAALTAMGCDMGQGFHLGLPLEEKTAFSMLPQAECH